MAARESKSVLTLEQVKEVAAFEGFSPEDFAVFAIPGFESRMPALRERIKPKLTRLGPLLLPRLVETLGETVYPHVAQHLRRTVNPPMETWVAFAKEKRAYKPFVHLRAGISAEKVRVTVFVEDYADEKEIFAANLADNADSLAAYLAHHPAIRAFEITDEAGESKYGSALDADTLRAFAERMKRIRGQHAIFGIVFASSHPVVQNGPEFVEAVLEAAKVLKPLYDCGKPGFAYTYTPEVIEGL